MTAETAADGTADALDFQSDTTPAVHRRVVYAYFSGIKFIEPAIFAFRNIGHNHIGTALQSYQPAMRVQTFHCRGGRNVNVRHQDTHHRHSAQSQLKRTAGGIGKRRFRMGMKGPIPAMSISKFCKKANHRQSIQLSVREVRP